MLSFSHDQLLRGKELVRGFNSHLHSIAHRNIRRVVIPLMITLTKNEDIYQIDIIIYLALWNSH